MDVEKLHAGKKVVVGLHIKLFHDKVVSKTYGLK
jgi:hypothetical protein